MDLFQTSAREKRSTFVKVIAGCLLAFIIAPPLAQAAVTTIKGTVKVKDSGGGAVNASAVPGMGLFDAEGSTGALDVRTFSGGGGFLGAGDCASATALPATTTVNAPSIITGLIMTGGDAEFQVSSEATDAAFGVPATADFPIVTFKVDNANENEVVAFGNGLTATAPLKVTCVGTDGEYAILGQ